MNIILVTGALGGVGQEICKEFKSNKWIVIGTDIKDNFEGSNIDFFIKADLSIEYNTKKIIDKIKEKYNKLDCIVNNAALQICKPFWEMEGIEWDLIYNSNVKSIFLLSKYALELLKINKGNIINIASIHSVATSDKIAAYASSKAAIVGLTRNLAIELSKFGIRVNCISPGAIDTKMLRDGLKRDNLDIEKMKKAHLLGDIGKPDNIAKLVTFLANNELSNFINGSNLIIDGGVTIKLSSE